MNKTPIKVAVIVPYKNAEPWLARCLKSIDERFAVYPVNDHSTDRSEDIINELGMRSLCVMTTLGGVARARNLGVDAALLGSCDYITFLDADDELTPDAWEQINGAIREAPDAPIIQLNHYIERNGSKSFRFYNRRGTYPQSSLPKFWVSVVNKIYKAELIKGKPYRLIFDTELRHGEDELFNLEAMAKAKSGIYCTERAAYIHHKDNPNSLSKSTTHGDLIGEQNALLDFLEYRGQHNPELCEAVRKRQLELWDNPTYRRIFGGKSK